MTHMHNVTQGDVLAAIVEAGKAIYQAEEATAKSIADGSKQQVNIGSNFVTAAEDAVTNAINSFNTYEAQVQAAQHSSFWGSLFGWVVTIVAVVASAFAGPEVLLLTVALTIASKTGALDKLQTALGNAIGSKLLAGVILTAVLMAATAGAGGAAGAIEEDAGSIAEEAGSVVAKEAGSSVEEESSSLVSKMKSFAKSAGKSVSKKVASLSRWQAGALNGLGQGLQNFNIGAEIAKEMSKLHAKWATALGVSLEVLVNVIAIVSEGAGTGNGVMRASAAGKGLCGLTSVTSNSVIFKAVGSMGIVGGAGQGSCSIATGVFENAEASAIGAYTKAQGQSELFDALKEMSHDGFTSWINGNSALEKALAKQATEVGKSISAVNTELAIAMSGRG